MLPEQLELFAKRGLSGADTDYLQRIGSLYDGHPLVLRVIAEDIKDIKARGGERATLLAAEESLLNWKPTVLRHLSRPKLRLDR